MLVHQEQVLRLDVEMLKLMFVVHHVQRFGRFVQIREQLFARKSAQTLVAIGAELVPEIAIGELGQDHQPAVNDVVPLE